VKGAAEWDINRGEIVLHAAAGVSRAHQFGEISGVIEAAYAAEINCFIDAIQGAVPWPHRYTEYQFALATLAAAEASAGRNTWAAIDPAREPDRVLAPASQ
jgi:hypothetical protein